MPRSFLITNRRYKKLGGCLLEIPAKPSVYIDKELEEVDNGDSLSYASTPTDALSRVSFDGSNNSCSPRSDCSFPVLSQLPVNARQLPAVDSPQLRMALSEKVDQQPSNIFVGPPFHHPPPLEVDRVSKSFRFDLLPKLLNYLGSNGATTRRPEVVEEVSLKSAYYTLDHNLNELVERSWKDADDLNSPTDLHVCPECGKQYSTSSNLARHRQTHRSHGNSERKSRKCPHCDKVYISMPAYSMHVRTHNQGCACPHCGKRFSRPWLLQGHVRTHTGEKPFRCPQCAKTFADKSNLRAHIQTHSNEKPFVCGRCNKAFALKSYLYKHEESSCMRSARFFGEIQRH